ncbi:MAG: glutaredoxin family protein [Planctomycetota bacterium]
MDLKHVEGNQKRDVRLYALSTCVWCRKTKDFLNKMSIDYYYIDVDGLQGKERQEVVNDIMRFNPQCSFPTMVVNKTKAIVGYKEDEMKIVLGL